MKLIVGLGNPSAEYLNTFHNLGFLSADAAAKLLGITFAKEKFKASIAEFGTGENKIIVAKPLTYMNLSGESVKQIVNFYKLKLSDLIVIYDDFDLKKGHIRIREKGSAGTHNGMKNIIKELGSDDFARIRVGFKPSEPTMIPLVDYVLSGIGKEDSPLFLKMTQLAGQAAVEYAKGTPLETLMQKYNGLL